MPFLVLLIVEVAFAGIALALRARIVMPVALVLLFATLFAHFLYGEPLPRLW